MKIAYISRVFSKVSGIERKLGSIAKAARSLGADLDVYALNLREDSKEENLIRVNIAEKGFPGMRLAQRKLFRYGLIKEHISLDAYDKVFLRWPGADLSSSAFAREWGGRTVTEHHTSEVGERLCRGSSLWNRMRAHQEEKSMRYFLSRVAGFIGVTEEIRREKASLSSRPSAAISNGIDVDSFSATGFRPFDGREIKMIFSGSDFSQPWNGLDRILSGLAAYKGNVQFTLYIVGSLTRRYDHLVSRLNPSSVRVIFTGEKSSAQADEIFKECHIAVSSLAVFRKNMKEACSLKTREYLARGIPFIYAYNDSDLSGDEEVAIKIEASDQPVDLERVVEFIRTFKNPRDVSACMRDLARTRLDWKIKVRQWLDFFEKIR